MSWADWRPKIAKACDGSYWTIEAIEKSLSEGTRLIEGEGCCYIVELQDYPSAKACQIMWAAGDLDAILAQLPKVEKWASLNGCTEMLVEGRPSWQRALKSQDYRPWSVTLRKSLT